MNIDFALNLPGYPVCFQNDILNLFGTSILAEEQFPITVKSLFVAAATIEIDDFLAQNLLSKNYVLLQLLFKGGYYLRVATNKDFTVYLTAGYIFSQKEVLYHKKYFTETLYLKYTLLLLLLCEIKFPYRMELAVRSLNFSIRIKYQKQGFQNTTSKCQNEIKIKYQIV